MKRLSTLLSAEDIVRVFVDAALHISPHRRLAAIYCSLISSLLLYLRTTCMLLLVEKHVILPTGKELVREHTHTQFQ